MSSGLVVVFLSMLLGLQPLATDLYLPALPALTAGFGATMHQAQLTLTGLLLAFGLSQLVWGPLSDRYGRRPILLTGMTAFTLASVGSVFATNMEQLLVWRAIQGAAMGAAVMCARAIVRDLYAPTDGARMMSKGLSGLGVFACISAPLGGLLSDWMGWRAALGVLAVFGAIALTMLVLRFEETLKTPNPQALRLGGMVTAWRGILGHPTFWTYALLAATSYGGLFTFLATSSFVFINALGLSKTQYGLLMFSMSLVYLTGTVICRRLILRLGVRRTVGVAGVFTLTGGSLMGLSGLMGWHNTWAIMLPYYLFIMAHGVHQPCGQSGAVSPFPLTAGTASALSGFLITMVAFLMGQWLGSRMPVGVSEATVLAMTNGLWFWSVVIASVAWWLVPRYGELRPPPQRTQPSPAP